MVVRAFPGLCAALVLGGCGASPTRIDGPARVDAEARATADVEPIAEDALTAHAFAVDAMRRGDLGAAKLELERIVAAYPELPGPYVNVAIIHRRDGRDDDALRVLEHVLSLDPNHPEANNELGILMRERGEFGAAEAAYRRALERRPDYALALYNLGVLLDIYLRRSGEALAYYEAYQNVAGQPDERVARWIIDLRRRVPPDDSARLAQGDRS